MAPPLSISMPLFNSGVADLHGITSCLMMSTHKGAGADSCTYRCLLKPQTQAHILAAVLARVVRAHVDTALNAQVAAGLVLVLRH